MSLTAETAVDERVFRDAMGAFASGVTIITGHDGSEPIGFTCQSFSSVSVDPMLVSFSVMKSSTSYPRIRATGRFAVNVLAREQHDLSSRFARRGTDKWAGVEWRGCAAGNPVIDGALMWVSCDIRDEFDAGDHWIVVGSVRELAHTGGDPLLFFRGGYRELR